MINVFTNFDNPPFRLPLADEEPCFGVKLVAADEFVELSAREGVGELLDERFALVVFRPCHLLAVALFIDLPPA